MPVDAVIIVLCATLLDMRTDNAFGNALTSFVITLSVPSQISMLPADFLLMVIIRMLRNIHSLVAARVVLGIKAALRA
jgi:hypothetical protein